jgi:hypothetical protein
MLGFILRGERVTLVGSDFVSTVVAAINSGDWDVFADLVHVRPVLVFRVIDLPEVLNGVICDLGHHFLLLALGAQRYYAPAQPAYWLSVQGGWVDRSNPLRLY